MLIWEIFFNFFDIKFDKKSSVRKKLARMKKLYFLFSLVLLIACAPTHYIPIPDGVHYEKILIRSEPTKAKIFIDDKYVGKTPIKTFLWYKKEKFINIKAEPIDINQFPQNIFLKIPPIPLQLTIYMDYDIKAKQDIELLEKDQKDVKQDYKIPEKIVTVEKEIPLILPTIFFDFDEFELKESEESKLEQIKNILENNSEYSLSIHAHTDELGTNEYNRQLALKRALAVKDFLVENGIEEDKMQVFVHGEQTTTTESLEKLGYEQNRIVDFKIHEMGN